MLFLRHARGNSCQTNLNAFYSNSPQAELTSSANIYNSFFPVPKLVAFYGYMLACHGNSICPVQNQSKFIVDSPAYLLGILYVVRKAYFIFYRIKWAVLLKADPAGAPDPVLLMQLPLSCPSSVKIPLSCEREAIADLPLPSPFTSIIK